MKKVNVIALGMAVLLVLCLISSKKNSFERTVDEKLIHIVIPKDDHIRFSSSPYEYMNTEESKTDYEYIVSHGDKSLRYMLRKFASSKDDGLQEYIMALACSEILQEDPAAKDWDSGRKWYNDRFANTE
ncbi:hypothetical protein [Paenibacillus sp. MMO-58]|uniref:hypothetical protein n=1 Tax=Paenibacillus sp. MMO-58 TaxID=3081290 RepID=UPI0030176D82